MRHSRPPPSIPTGQFHKPMEALLPSSLSPKISAILQSHVYPRVGHVLRALARIKYLLLDALGERDKGARRKHAIGYRRSRSKKTGKLSSGFKKPRLAWSGSSSPARVETVLDVDYHVYSCYGSTWNAVVPAAPPAGAVDGGGGQDCGYLCWLEEEMPDEMLVVEEEEGEDVDDDGAGGGNEIDRLAERFIARCHARFLLEKQESYRRCQEMIARSM